MGRPKKQFTDEQKFRITQMAELNKTLAEIVEDLKDNYNIAVHPTTLSKFIESMGITRIDGRKWNADKGKNHNNGYIKDKTIESKEKSPSKYKMRKYYDCEDEITAEEAKQIGYGSDGNPLNFRVLLGKDGGEEEIEMLITSEQLSFKGGEGCKPKSKRWWMIERIKFDKGNRYHPLLPGQIKGDWRGVVDRFLYDDEDYLRVWGDSDIVHWQQEAWERYVDAVYDYTKKHPISGSDKHKYNKYILNSLNDEQFDKLMRLGPDVIYKYIPPHLYGSVVCYCIDKMMKDDRIIREQETILETTKRIMAHTRVLITEEDAHIISLENVKRCLTIHPNDYKLVVMMCVCNALDAELIKPEYRKTIVDVVTKIQFKNIDDPNSYNQCNADGEWLAANDDRLYRAVYGKFEDLNSICEELGIVFGNNTSDVNSFGL